MSENRDDAEGLAPETLAAQAMGHVDGATGALIPPIYLTSTFERAPDLSYPASYTYSRDGNPTYAGGQELLARLEGGAACLLFASGMAAMAAVFTALPPGSHVLIPEVFYHGGRSWLQQWAQPWGLRIDTFASDRPDTLARALRQDETRLVFVETPANPSWIVADIARIAELTHAAGARLVVDSTAATPVLTRPLELGADLVMHSATKFLNGHTDLVAGALVTATCDGYWQRIATQRKQFGAVLGPMEAWLLVRGMRTLYLRVQRASDNALTLARHLSQHPGVRQVLYPGLVGHPGHHVAKRQMHGGFGPMMSVCVRGGRDAAVAVQARLRVFKRATSLGGVESLVEHRKSVEPESPIPDDLLRLSIGIERVDDLIADFERALR